MDLLVARGKSEFILSYIGHSLYAHRHRQEMEFLVRTKSNKTERGTWNRELNSNKRLHSNQRMTGYIDHYIEYRLYRLIHSMLCLVHPDSHRALVARAKKSDGLK